MTVFAAVEASELFEVVWVSLVAGVAVNVLFSLVVRLSSRSVDARRSGGSAASVIYAGLAVLTFAVFAGLVIYGVNVMLSKD
jgi:hypothetical protein